MSFQAELKSIDPKTKEVKIETYKFEFKFEFRLINANREHELSKKGDIHSFVLRTLKKRAQLRAKGKEVDGLILKKDNFLALAGSEKERLLQDIMDILNLPKMINKLYKKSKEYVYLLPKKETFTGLEQSFSLEENFKLELKISKLTSGKEDNLRLERKFA